MPEYFAYFLQFLTENRWAVYAASLLIVGGAFIAYFFWFRAEATKAQSALQSLVAELDLPPGAWSTAKQLASQPAATHPGVRDAWRETEQRVISIGLDPNPLFAIFGPPRDLWKADRLLGRSVNLPLMESVPNLLVGIGLLFTFFFLTIALVQATSALLPQSGAAGTDLTVATRGLLSAAGGKFLTSLAGLFASIWWSICYRRRIAALNAEAEQVVDRISRIVSTNGAELCLYAQLQTSRDSRTLIQRLSNSTSEFSTQSIEATRQHLQLTDEILNESREQTGSLKRFETDLAISLANAISQTFSPEMERMTSRLIQAIDGLTEKVGTMNQEALSRMINDFGEVLQTATATEMAGLKGALEALATRLTASGDGLVKGAESAATGIGEAGDKLISQVSAMSDSLSAGAMGLQKATEDVRGSLQELDASIRRAGELGGEGAAFVRSALDTAEQAFEKLVQASLQLGNAGGSLERMSGHLVTAVNSVEELSQEQRAVVVAVRDATPQALASVNQVLGLLEKAVDTTARTMEGAKRSMVDTSATLGETVTTITTGVSEYSRAVADLHRNMDDKLGRAVGGLLKGITELEGAIEDLSDVSRSRV